MLNSSPTFRPRTSEKSPSPDDTALPSIPEGNGKSHPPRRSSLGFLRRAKSGEPLSGTRSASGSKLSKKQQRIAEEQEQLRLQREAAERAKLPPKLPDFAPPPQLRTFGGEDEMSETEPFESNRAAGNNRRYIPRASMETAGSARYHGVPVPPLPGSAAGGQNGDYVDPYARTESMTHRGRYSYASSAVSTINSPRRVRRRKDPTPFKLALDPINLLEKCDNTNILRQHPRHRSSQLGQNVLLKLPAYFSRLAGT